MAGTTGDVDLGTVIQSFVAGAARVTTGKSGTPHNRNINAASSTYAEATNSATWTTAVTNITITPLVTTTQGATQNGQACLVVYNAPDAATASSWLSDAGSASADVQYDIIYAGQSLSISSVDGFTRVDVLPIGTGNTVMRVVIGAV